MLNFEACLDLYFLTMPAHNLKIVKESSLISEQMYNSLQDTGHSPQHIYQKAFDVVRNSMLKKAEAESDYKTKHILQDLNFKDFEN